MAEVKKFQGGLYPTIAVSDFFQASIHTWAAKVAYDKGEVLACAGFLTVALAGFVGTLRFGFSESMFAQANQNLADVAAFVGLPCIGLAFVPTILLVPFFGVSGLNKALFVLGLLTIEAITRPFSPGARKLTTIALNLVCFIIPVALITFGKQNFAGLAGIVLFALAGIVITTDRHRYIFRVRCENWFHYCIGIAAYFIADAL